MMHVIYPPEQRHNDARNSDHPSVEDPLPEYSLRLLGTHVCVGRLLGDEYATDLAVLLVHLVHLHLDGTLTDVEDFVCLLEELFLPLLAIGNAGREANCLVVASVHAAALRIQEAAATVRWHHVLATPLEAWLELVALTFRNQVLHGEHEGHILAIGD